MSAENDTFSVNDFFKNGEKPMLYQYNNNIYLCYMILFFPEINYISTTFAIF